MHVVDNKLVGTIVSDVYTENGSVIIVLTDNDTTPVREMQTYSYIQTKELAEIGIAINPKGVVTIPVYTLAGFNGELDSSLYAITVKYNGELYQIGLADFIELTAGEAVDYVPYVESTYPGQTIGAVIPPFSDENAGQIISVNEETGKLEWRDETEELPAIEEGDAGKVLTVNAGGTGTEWGDIPEELPTIESGDAGKVLKVNSGETGTEWGDIPTELPTIESGDAGKVLKVNAGETGTEWGDIPEELPSVTGNAGKVLKVNSGATGTEWGDVPNELPTIASGDAGKVLKVNADENGTEWGTASGGAIYSHKITFDIEVSLNSVTETLHLSINIVNSSSTPFTMATLETELRRLGYNNTQYLYPVTGAGYVLVNNTKYAYYQPVGVSDSNSMGSWDLGVAVDQIRYDSSTNTMEYRSSYMFTSWNNFTDTVTQV